MSLHKRLTTDAAREKECTEKCQSYQHANELNSAITLPPTGILDKQLASYFKSRCSNFAKLRDNYGRSLLHMAASCGRRDLTIWLLQICAENINLAEIESGYTALHRSIGHGFINIAVALIRMNANLNVKDYEDLCPLDMLLEDLHLPSVDKLFYNNFPQQHDPVDSQSEDDEDDDSVTTFTSKSHKKSNIEYDRFISFYNGKREFLDNAFNAFATEVYTWGTNLNYTSGFASASGKLNPEFLEFFERKNEVIIEISMQKFHTLFVSLSGKVWSCGIGQGGRIGLSSGIVLIPEQVSLTSPSVSNALCLSVATGRDHSIFLCIENKVFVCGMNKYHQLGISPPPASVTKPVQVKISLRGKQIFGVAASDFHSLVWTHTGIFTCGLNAGQLGHQDSENTIPTFKKVPIEFVTILSVTVSKAATLVANDSYLFVLTNYKCFKIEVGSISRSIRFKVLNRNGKRIYLPIPLRETFITKLAAFGGELDSEKTRSFSISQSAEELQIAVVFRDGSLYLWRKRDERFLRCYFLTPYSYDISVTDVIINSRGMWISTKKGEVLKVQPLEIIDFHVQLNDGFILIPRYGPRRLSKRTSVYRECYVLQGEKLESAFRAVKIFSDPLGDNFAMLQFRSPNFLKSVPSSINVSSLRTDLTKFYCEMEDAASLHDIVFKVKQRSFVAHKYILASCSEQFLKLKADNGVVVIDDMSPEVFETILEFAYTGFCRIRKHSYRNSQSEVLLKRVYEAAVTFKITELANFLTKIKPRGSGLHSTSDNLVNKEVISFPCFNRLKFSSLYDIKLKSHDGTVFNAHKCILIARVEYFKNMLSGNWIESRNPNQSCYVPFSNSVLNEILEYLYTDKISKSAENKDEQFWSSLLLAADHFMLAKLKEYSEKALLSYMNVRNVVDFLMLADLINANQLKTWCFEFICHNLSSILFFKYLDRMNHQQLDQLTEYYRKEFDRPSFEKFPDIPVYSTVCDISEILAAEQSYPIDWDVISDVNCENDDLILRVEKTKPKTKLKKPRKSVTRERDGCTNQNSNNKICSSKRTATLIVEETSVVDNKLPEEEWIAVERQLKSVKSRLKVNAAVRECPQLIEQKENYVPIKDTKSLTDFEPNTIPRDQMTASESNYCIDINFSQLTPRVSQAERKRLRKVSGSSKDSAGLSSPENSQKMEQMTDCASPGSPPGCWKALQQTSDSLISFSSIMMSEIKQKTNVMKETRKIVTKSLHSTQTEEQAIQELMTFYNVRNVDDEHITVQRVTHEINAPQWVTK